MTDVKQPEHLKYWSQETNPETGEQFELFRDTLMDLGNPDFDLDRFLSDEYAAELTKLLDRRFRFTPDPMGEACLEYYRSIGLKKEMFDTEGFYTRWVLFTPLELDENWKYPLIISLHGGMNTIETEEFADRFTEKAAGEGYIVVYPQNTNTDHVLEILERVKEMYPIDEERIYVTGFSQGGMQARALVTRHPELFAAYAPCGNDLYRPSDFLNNEYTDEEIRHLKETFVPFLQIVGGNEPNFHVPKYQWRPRLTLLESLSEKFPEETGRIRPGMDIDESVYGIDETYPHDENGKRTPTRHPAPAPGEDVPTWAENRVNLRLDLLGCEPRDIEKCLGYADHPDSETHKVLGFYGDRDGVVTYYGKKHYTADIWNRDGLHAFRFVAVENAPHWPFVAWAEIAWEFFRGFRRSSATGRILADRYRRNEIFKHI